MTWSGGPTTAPPGACLAMELIIALKTGTPSQGGQPGTGVGTGMTRWLTSCGQTAGVGQFSGLLSEFPITSWKKPLGAGVEPRAVGVRQKL